MNWSTSLRALAGLCALVSFSAANAQLNAAKDGGVVYGHHHIAVSNVEEHRRFWVDVLGGTEVPFADSVVVKFTNVILFVREEEPSGGTKGTTVNHIGFTVANLAKLLDDVSAAGHSVVTAQEVPATMPVKDDIAYNETQDAYLAFVMAPDDVKIEFIDAPGQLGGAKLHHVHFAAQDIDEMRAWYAKTLGAIPGMRGNFKAADLPGVNLTFSESPQPLVGTKGRSLDHIGFEVDGLQAYCEELEKQGIEFDVPYREIDSLDLSSAFFTDPFGTYIELTEGLDRL